MNTAAAGGAGKESQRIGGYEILAKLGQGGMGAVFKARQVSMNRIVALKVLLPNRAADPDFVTRFLREARSAGQLSHPNLINVYDCGRDGQYYYFSMEFVEGQSLKQVLKAHGPLDEATAIRHLIAVARALGAAHAQGIVHRDVKPDNIMLDRTGEPKLGDLGLAKPMSGELDVTLGGNVLGTPHYIAPEQARGEAVDGRADLYALGASFHHLLTGRTLFTGDTSVAISIKHATEEPTPIRRLRPDISVGMERILLRLLRKKPDQRHPDAQALIHDLEALARGEPVGQQDDAHGPGRGRHGGRGRQVSEPRLATRAPRTPWGIYLGLGAGIVATAVIIVLNLPKAPPPEAPRPTAATAPAVAAPRPASAPAAAPVPPPAPVAATPAKPDGPAAMLAFARRYLTEHPEDFAKARDYFAQAHRAGAGTVVAMEADQELARLETAWNAQCRVALDALVARSQEQATAGDFDAAQATLAACDRVVAERLAKELAQARDRIDQAATQAVADLLTRSGAEIEADRLDEADRMLAHLAGLKARAAVAAAQARIDALRQTAATRREALAGKAAALWQAVEKALIDALVAGDAAAARDQAETLLKDPANAAAAPRLQAVLAVSRALDDRAGEKDRFLKGAIGNPLSLATRSGVKKGKLLSYDKRFIKIETLLSIEGIERIVALPVRWEDLTPAQLNAFTAGWTPADAHGRIALACLAIGAKDLAGTEAALAQAQDHPLAPALGERARELRLGAAEVACEKAWRPLAAKDAKGLNEAAAKGLLADLDAFQAAHGKTQTFAGLKTEWQGRRDAAFARTASGRLKAGLELHWPIDGTNPHLWTDASGNGRDWKIDPAYSLELFAGPNGGAAARCRPSHRMPGFGRGMIQPEIGHLATGWKTFTLALWVIADPWLASENYLPILASSGFGEGNPLERHFLLSWHAGQVRFGSDAPTQATLAESCPTGQWRHLACTFDAARPANERWRLFFDGKPAGSLSSAWTEIPVMVRREHFFWMGVWNKDQPDTKPTFGFDDIRIYKRALEPDDITALVAVGRAPVGPQPRQLVVHNGSNGGNNNAGVRTFTVRFLKGGKTVKESRDVNLPWAHWARDVFPSVAIEAPPDPIDTIRLEITAWEVHRPCLSEVQFFDGFQNLILNGKVKGTPGFHPSYDLDELVDGKFGDGCYWLPAKGEPAWLEFTVPAAKSVPP